MKVDRKVTIRDNKEYGYMYEEALKTLRTNVMLSGRNIHTIMITSTVQNEGKSELSMQLAKQFGEAGKKTLYIDCDIRKAGQNAIKLPKGFMGLTHYLSGQCGIDDIAWHTSMANVDIIMASATSPNPSELFEDPSFAELVEQAKKQYDYIVLDTAPIGLVIDAAIIGQHCDGAVFVVAANEIGYRASQKAVAQIKKSGCKIIGAVLNKVDPKKSSVYGGKYGKYGKKYGQFGYGYGSSKRKK